MWAPIVRSPIMIESVRIDPGRVIGWKQVSIRIIYGNYYRTLPGFLSPMHRELFNVPLLNNPFLRESGWQRSTNVPYESAFL